MNYADFGLGTWQPKNGFYDVVKAMISIAEENGAVFNTNSEINKIEIEKNQVKGIYVNGELQKCDILISGADYHHTESLLEERYRQYSESYWNNRTWSPLLYCFILVLIKNYQI